MKNSHSFFTNRDCAYFPCHKGVAEEDFNCLFCFCPLYFLKGCGGRPTLTPDGIKDCSGCTVPHAPGGYEHVLQRLRREFDAKRAEAAAKTDAAPEGDANAPAKDP
ncbi:cysteine-rich small domain-containing protein [Desulfovibrio sp. X2]|uniref:cysteine-rich small domain-containing protein n=1 Tax=Desulfovibrio sp. X2 TaxID=941449 RepID=UPI000358C786|nr:cysteine-rich small domain-containing protein [Desulfovibrio sp. X2]EPR44414.1 cysteine-rich small domain-containing protein [Desulfovibrio sp. X2]